MPQSDAIRVTLKFFPAVRQLALGLASGLVACVFFVRFTQNPDAIGRALDEGLAGIAGIFALWLLLRGAWRVLVIRQQDRAPKALRSHPPAPNAKPEDPDDAIRRMSGRSRN
jgi:hypothetical protein